MKDAWRGELRFCDPGMIYDNDSEKDGVVFMHLPSHMFSAVVDVLRNEDPLYIYFAFGRGFFRPQLSQLERVSSQSGLREEGSTFL